jgi:hypothetical protein
MHSRCSALNSGVSAFPAACCGLESEYDNVPTLRIEDSLQLATGSFNRFEDDGIIW